MSKYGCGLTFGQISMLEKERIKHALRGELVCGETDAGFAYDPASKEECDQFILSAYDDCVYQAKAALASGRALERLLQNKEVEYTHLEYGQIYEAEVLRYLDDYQYETELE